MKRSNLYIAIYLVLIFACGIVVGAFATRMYRPNSVLSSQAGGPPPRLSPEEWRRQYTNEMTKRLNLTPDQLVKLNTVLDYIGGKVHAEHERHTQAMKVIRDEHVAKVREILTPAQVPEYEKLREERERRAKQQSGQQK